MKRWKWKITSLLLVALLVTTASAHSHPFDEGYAPTVSSWAQEEVNRAMELGLVPDAGYGRLPDDFRQDITRGQFTYLAMEFLSVQQHESHSWILERMAAHYLAEEDPDSTSYPPAIKPVFTDDDTGLFTVAYHLGLVEGRGDGTFDPEGRITREEAAVMLARAYRISGGTLPEDVQGGVFPDEGEIADWAKEGALSMASWNVIKGMDDGSFNPRGSYTIEQCVLTFLRLYENGPVSRKNSNVTSIFTYEQCLEYIVKPGISGEAYRIEGPQATFVRTDSSGVSTSSSSFYFVYRDGGIHSIDFGICLRTKSGGITPGMELINPRFSEDGKAFYCSFTVEHDVLIDVYNEDTETFDTEAALAHEKGVYHITIDVDSGAYQHQIEPLAG